ncbi:MAG: glycosyltransferase [Sphingobacteriales bacterium]|nr:MAG: glycosyltransferase [Sphingobacteriales bacterium]
MKIMFVVSGYYPEGAGAGRSVRNLAEGVLQAGHDVSVVRLTQPKTKPFMEMIEGVRVHYLPIRNLYFMGKIKRSPLKRFAWHLFDMFNPWAAYDFWKVVRKEKPDVINTSVIAGFSTSIFLVARFMGITLVHTMRDYYLMCPQNAMYRNGANCTGVCKGCKPFFHARKMVSGSVDLFLSNSEFVEERHRSLNFLKPETPCQVQFNMNEDDTISSPRTLSTQGPVKLGFIGRVDPTKGIDILLKALTMVEFDNWELTIAGKGADAYIDHLRQTFPDPRITFAGFAEPNAFYNNIDILICPSVYGEPLPRVVYEAYRAALPVIAARAGGIPEIVDDGVTGFSYEPYDVAALASHIQQLASNPDAYKRFSEQAAIKAVDFKKTTITNAFLQKVEAVRT